METNLPVAVRIRESAVLNWSVRVSKRKDAKDYRCDDMHII